VATTLVMDGVSNSFRASIISRSVIGDIVDSSQIGRVSIGEAFFCLLWPL
jgi:hypothetical protein